MDFTLSVRQVQWRDRVKGFIDTHLTPRVADHDAEMEQGGRWKTLKVVEEEKARAKAAGLWNLFMPPSATDDHVDRSFKFEGPGLTKALAATPVAIPMSPRG